MFGEFLTSIPAPYPKKGQGSVMNQSQILFMSIKFVLSSPKFRNFDSERKTLVRVRTEGRSTGSKKVHYMHSSSTCNSTSKVYVSCMYSEHKKKTKAYFAMFNYTGASTEAAGAILLPPPSTTTAVCPLTRTGCQFMAEAMAVLS